MLLFCVLFLFFLYYYFGFINAPYEFIEKEPFETEYGVIGLVRERQKKYRKTYVRYNCIGTCICVLSPIPFLAAAFTDDDMLTVFMLVVSMLIAGIGIMLFILAGVRWAGMQKLLKEGEYNPIEKKKSKIKETVGVVYWLLATAIFFLWSFLSNDSSGISGNDWISWRQSWIVWPVAGVLFGAVMMICNLIITGDE